MFRLIRSSINILVVFIYVSRGFVCSHRQFTKTLYLTFLNLAAMQHTIWLQIWFMFQGRQLSIPSSTPQPSNSGASREIFPATMSSSATASSSFQPMANHASSPPPSTERGGSVLICVALLLVELSLQVVSYHITEKVMYLISLCWRQECSFLKKWREKYE